MDSVKREGWQSRSVRPPERSCGASIFGSAQTLHGVAYCVCVSGVCLSATKVPILVHISPISHLKAQAERRGGSEFGGRWVSGNDFTGSCCYPGSSGSSQNALQQHSWWDWRQECWSSTHASTHLLYSATQTHCTFLHSGIDNGILKKKPKAHFTGSCCFSFTTTIMPAWLQCTWGCISTFKREGPSVGADASVDERDRGQWIPVRTSVN